MKYFTILAALFLSIYTYSVFAGVQIDADGDGYFCTVEDDGVYCDEDGQDLCPNIPNLNNEQAYCDMDLNGDGYVNISDIGYNAAVNDDHPFIGGGYGGDGCFYRMRFIEYNNRLNDAGLPLLLYGVNVPVHCLGHHSYPAIPEEKLWPYIM